MYNQLYVLVCGTLIGQLELHFDKDSLIMAKAIDPVLRSIPVGSAQSSFSAMRRIRNNWLRSTMGLERFSSLALLNIESDLLKKVKS